MSTVEQGTQTDISPLLCAFDAESHQVQPDGGIEKEKDDEDANIVNWDGSDDPVLHLFPRDRNAC